MDNQITIKIILIGNSTVGKTSILNRYISGKFYANTSSTIGVDYRQKQFTFNDQSINLFLFDTAGQERFHSVTGNYLRNVNCAIVVFDLTERETFNLLDHWIQEIINKADINEMVICFAGNKCDKEEEIDITDDEVKQKIEKLYKESKFFKTSAKRGNGINEMFDEIIKDILEKQETGIGNDSLQLIQRKKNYQRDKCCLNS